MPFGLKGAPATAHRAINLVLQDLLYRFVLVYFDDILMMGQDYVSLKQNTDVVLGRLAEFGLKLNQKKCRFAQTSVEFLGHTIGNSISPGCC